MLGLTWVQRGVCSVRHGVRTTQRWSPKARPWGLIPLSTEWHSTELAAQPGTESPENPRDDSARPAESPENQRDDSARPAESSKTIPHDSAIAESESLKITIHHVIY